MQVYFCNLFSVYCSLYVALNFVKYIFLGNSFFNKKKLHALEKLQ